MTDPGKRFKAGLYGGKFYPFHKGHAHCIDVASSECDVLYVVLFYDIMEEFRLVPIDDESPKYRGLLVRYPSELKCSPYARANSIMEYILNKDDNIKLLTVHKDTFNKDGIENWYSEADYIKSMIHRDLDAIYSSEPSYTSFFNNVYPRAVHRIIDPDRKEVPVSGTQIRSMPLEEAKTWIM